MDLVIVSMHEKGFPQADLYKGLGEISASEFEALGPVADDFFTMKRGDTLLDATAKAMAKWPGANVVEAYREEDDEDEDDTAHSA